MNVLIVAGTRPEVIKLAPVVWEMRKYPRLFRMDLYHSGQHTYGNLLPLFELLGIRFDYSFEDDLFESKPDLVVVQGDTNTAADTAVAAYRAGIPIAHVEAGLRSGDINSPWPEEGNRRIIDELATLHMCPTEIDYENVPVTGKITGNTSIDMVDWAVDKIGLEEQLPRVLVTIHRKENQTEANIKEIANGIIGLSRQLPDHSFIVPRHWNPKMQPLYDQLANKDRIYVGEPLDYLTSIRQIMKSDFLITDSGGIVEEAARLGRYCIIPRTRTERWPSVFNGIVSPCGANAGHICRLGMEAAGGKRNHDRLDLYGNGDAGKQIVEVIKEWMQ